MKKISQTTLTLSQKKEVTHYTQTLLGDIFTKKIESKEQLLQNVIEYTRSPLDPITINNLIQEELLKCVMLNILSKQPTLFAIQKITAKDFTTKYFAKLEPFITPNIFDNKICFNSFMANAIAIYIKEVNHEIVDHVNSNFWADSGFDIIAKNANELL
jgi:hypothetical protein